MNLVFLKTECSGNDVFGHPVNNEYKLVNTDKTDISSYTKSDEVKGNYDVYVKDNK
jgi:hypothetical protein